MPRPDPDAPDPDHVRIPVRAGAKLTNTHLQTQLIAARNDAIEWRNKCLEAEERAMKAEAERDEADRRAGAAERLLEHLREGERRTNLWLSEAKEEAGYDINTSFDVVWKETRERIRETEKHAAETAILAHDWMKRHDALLGFIQSRNEPGVLLDFLKADLPPYPSPPEKKP